MTMLPAQDLQDIVNSAQTLTSLDVDQYDLKPEHIDDRVYPVIQ